MIAQMNKKFGPGKSSANNVSSTPEENPHAVKPISKKNYLNLRKFKS